MAIRNDDGRAELAARLDQLYGIVDESPLLGLDEAEKEQLVAGAAADILYKDSYLPKLARSELERNLREGLSAADPTGMGGNNYFEPFRLTKAGYEHAKAAVIEAGKSISSETFRATSDYNEEVLDRAAFALIEHPYVKSGEGRERMFIEDAALHASFGDAYEKARAVYMENVPEARTNVLEPPRPKPRAEPRERPAERKGFVARHRKAIGAAFAASAMFAGIGYVAYNAWQDGVRSQERVDQLKSHGGTDDTAKGFNARYGPKLAGPGNIFNSSVLSLYDVHVDNATLAEILESGARTTDGSLWGTVKFAADNLQTPQYMPKTLVEAKCMSKLVKGVNDIAAYPKELKAYSMDSKTLLYDMGIGSANETAAWGGVRSVANYMLGLIRNGNITTAGLDGEDLRRLVMPIQLANTDIKTGEHGQYSLATFMKNTTPDDSLSGLTPLQWLGKTVNQIRVEKGPRYNEALRLANATLSNISEDDAQPAFRYEIKNLPEKNDILLLYEGGGLRASYVNANGTVTGPIVAVSGAYIPFYDCIVGMSLGMPVTVRRANYPMPNNIGQTMVHDDPCVWSPTFHRYVGPFMHPDEMMKSYTNPNIKMDLKEYTLDGELVPVTGN